MAATAEGAALTATHYRQQQALNAQTLRDALRLWPILDVTSDQSVVDWLGVNETLIVSRRRVSEALAAEYLQRFRAIEFDEHGTVPIVRVPFDAGSARAGLLVTGPGRLRRGGIDAERFASIGAAKSAARQVLNGGRDLIDATVTSDRRALGWARATSGHACAWCAMLASRGPVYRSEQSGGFDAHDGCSCVAEPVYTADASWPGRAREYRDLWDKTTRGLSGNDALNAFRSALG